jgi:hypothetical protein
MTVSDDTRSPVGAPTSDLPPGLLARCEGCGLVYEVDLLAGSDDPEADCDDCGSPVYVIPAGSGDEAVYLAGFGSGWDACAAFVASAATGRQLAELTEVGTEWAVRLAGGEG